jgi:hypothetical protein
MLSAIYCLRNEKSSFEYTIKVDEIQHGVHVKREEPVISAIDRTRLVYEDRSLERGNAWRCCFFFFSLEWDCTIVRHLAYLKKKKKLPSWGIAAYSFVV